MYVSLWVLFPLALLGMKAFWLWSASPCFEGSFSWLAQLPRWSFLGPLFLVHLSCSCMYIWREWPYQYKRLVLFFSHMYEWLYTTCLEPTKTVVFFCLTESGYPMFRVKGEIKKVFYFPEWVALPTSFSPCKLFLRSSVYMRVESYIYFSIFNVNTSLFLPLLVSILFLYTIFTFYYKKNFKHIGE